MPKLPADLADLADLDRLPVTIVREREGFGLEWYEYHPGDMTRSVVVYRFTRGGRLSWSACIAVSGGESFASITQRADAAV